jgi:hypothetical protein
MSQYLPSCCRAWRDESGQWVVGHDEHNANCRHTPSGGTGGRQNRERKCDRIIGHGKTRREAVEQARLALDMD